MTLVQAESTVAVESLLGRSLAYQAFTIHGNGAAHQSWHCHETTETVIVLSGNIWVELEMATSRPGCYKLQRGWQYRIPAGQTHRLVAEDAIIELFASGPDASPWKDTVVWSATEVAGAVHEALPPWCPRPGTTGTGIRIEVDPAVPGTDLGRKVYITRNGQDWRMPCPHSHASEHLLVCVRGKVQIAVGQNEECTDIWQIASGDIRRVPPRLVHQLKIQPASIVASYFPTSTWLCTKQDLQTFKTDWFA